MPPVVGVAVGVIVGDEEGEALAEAVGEGLAVDVSRGVGDCVGVGLGVTLGDGLAVSVALDHKIGLLLRCSGFAIRSRRKAKRGKRAGLGRAEIQVLDEAANVVETIGNEEARPLI